jgi:hypothetical protein
MTRSEVIEVVIEGIDDETQRAVQSRALQALIENNVPDVEISAPPRPKIAGSKGDPITIGVLLLAIIHSGAVPPLVEAIKAFLSRDHQLTITVRHGKNFVSISGKNINEAKLRDLFDAVAAKS